MELHVFPNDKILSSCLADWIAHLIHRTLDNNAYFSMALSGGSTPKSLFRELADNQEIYNIDWEKVVVFWGDERVVPFSDERNNAGMAYTILLNKIPILPKNIYRMRTDISPEQAVEEYDHLLRHFFKKDEMTFDLVLLGMGDDGHTLSLFPGSDAISDATSWVREVYNKEQKMYRITLMPAIVNRSRKIAFMIAGENKSSILKNVLEDSYQPDIYPSQLIIKNREDIDLFLDNDAASQIKTVV
ncbi:MAG: 6-phosphogluconolactonase [Ginsengibacter sp.]